MELFNLKEITTFIENNLASSTEEILKKIKDQFHVDLNHSFAIKIIEKQKKEKGFL